MLRKPLFVAIGLAGLLVLAGCAGASPEAATTPRATPTAKKIDVPDLVGMSRADARKALQGRGLSAVDESEPATSDATVIDQDPAAGSSADLGTVVTLTFDAAQTPTPTPEASALMLEIQQKFPGYPLVVSTTTVDKRVANWVSLNGQTTTRLVALAPGVYAAYNPAVTDLSFYVDQGDTAEGDCTLIKAMFSDRGGACWDGVSAGSAEPHQ